MEGLNFPSPSATSSAGFWQGEKPTSATLCYNKQTKEFYINVVINREVPFPPGGGNIMGIDRGICIYNLATTSNGLKFSGRQAMHVRKRYARLRQALQAKGTKGAKRLLKRLSGTERRWMSDLNHRIAKAVVQSCKLGDVIVMENLGRIRERVCITKVAPPPALLVLRAARQIHRV